MMFKLEFPFRLSRSKVFRGENLFQKCLVERKVPFSICVTCAYILYTHIAMQYLKSCIICIEIASYTGHEGENGERSGGSAEAELIRLYMICKNFERLATLLLKNFRRNSRLGAIFKCGANIKTSRARVWGVVDGGFTARRNSAWAERFF